MNNYNSIKKSFIGVAFTLAICFCATALQAQSSVQLNDSRLKTKLETRSQTDQVRPNFKVAIQNQTGVGLTENATNNNRRNNIKGDKPKTLVIKKKQ